MVPADSPYKTFKDLAEAARKAPNTLVAATTSIQGTGRQVVWMIERRVMASGAMRPPIGLPKVRLLARAHTPLSEVVHTLLHLHRQRTLVGLALMASQAFFYNAIFFTYALVLTKFYHVSNDAVPVYGLAFAVGNLAGPLLLGHLFDTLGRKKMIAGTYLLSGSMLAASAWLFDAGVLHAAGQTFIWIVVFFFASAGASAGYLTVSEIFPIEIRAEALAVFFAIAQVVGAVGPAFYGVLIGNGASRTGLAIGYVVGGGIMIVGGLVEIVFGIDAEGKSLEQVAAPLTLVDD
jgi:MFS family permease